MSLRREREILVSGLAKALKDLKGFELRAVALGGASRKPWTVAGFTPDVIAYDPIEQLLQLGDVITEEDLSSSHIEEKLLAHTRLVMQTGGSKGKRVPLHVAVSVDNEEVLDELLGMLKMEDRVKVWTTGQVVAC